MLKLIGGILAGLVIWAVTVTVLNLGLRHGIAGYQAGEASMTFTLPMMIGRLSISAVSSLASGYGAAALAGRGRAATIAGIILLILFLPVHYMLFNRFPLWYHLTFLVSLPVLSIAGGMMARRGAKA